MEYNSQRGHLIIPEYGRNIQKMIEYAMSVEDREQRNKVAKSIVDVMGQLNPHLRDITDFKHKLWDHLFVISDFKLDVDSPYPIPTAHTLDIKPQRIPYPSKKIKYKHYGKIIELIIDELAKLENNPRREAMIEKMANFMKMVYLNWNRDTVNDELIAEHLKILSNGKLELSENARLSNTNDILAKSVKKSNDRGDRDRGDRDRKSRSSKSRSDNGRKREPRKK